MKSTKSKSKKKKVEKQCKATFLVGGDFCERAQLRKLMFFLTLNITQSERSNAVGRIDHKMHDINEILIC